MTIALHSQLSVLMWTEDKNEDKDEHKDEDETEDENDEKECRTQDLLHASFMIDHNEFHSTLSCPLDALSSYPFILTWRAALLFSFSLSPN